MKVTDLKDGQKVKTLNDYHFKIYAGTKYYENLVKVLPSYELPFGKLPIGKRLGALTTALKTGKKLSEV